MMRWIPSRRLLALVTLVALAVPSLAAAQSLADIARKEQARRKEVGKATKTYTNTDLTRDYTPSSPSAADGSAPADSSGAAATTTPAAPAASSEAPAAGDADSSAEPKKDQAYWKGRVDTARATLERSKTFADALQTRINSLSTDFTNRDDPAQRAVIAQDRVKTIGELERVQREIAAQTKAITAIEDEARKAGVPAGWLR